MYANVERERERDTYYHSCLLHPDIKLIILSAPPPEQVRQSIDLKARI